MSTGPFFKLSKTAKRMLASTRYTDKHKASEYKKLAIDSESTYDRMKHMSYKADKQSKE